MAPRKLSPSILAALGLSACVDGCEPEDLPIVGRLFDGGEQDQQTCLNIPEPIDVPPEDVGPCLEIAPVGPCLDMAVDTAPPPPAPNPAPEHVQPCLLIVMPAPVVKPTPVGPCLKVVQPPRVGPCLRMAPIRTTPQATPKPVAPQDDGAGALDPGSTSGEDVLEALIRDGILAEDVVARLSEAGRGQDRLGPEESASIQRDRAERSWASTDNDKVAKRPRRPLAGPSATESEP